MSSQNLTQRLLAKINLVAKRVFAGTEFTIGVPAADSSTVKNTKVVLTAVPGNYLSGTVDLTYDRVELAEMVGVNSTDFEAGDYSKSTDLVAALVARYGYELTAADLVDEALPAAAGDGVITATLKAAAGSLGWIGTLEVTLTPATETLASAFNSTELDGFTPADLTA